MQSTLLLARTFFSRFFESDLMPSGLPQVQLMIWSLALLAGPGLFLPVSFTITYTSAVDRGESDLVIVSPRLLTRLDKDFITEPPPGEIEARARRRAPFAIVRIVGQAEDRHDFDLVATSERPVR